MEISNDLNSVTLNNVDITVKSQSNTSEIGRGGVLPPDVFMPDDVFVSLSEGNNILADILKLAGFKVTPESMKMLQEMIQNNLPVNKDTLKSFNQAVKLMGGDFDKALFLIKNEIPMTSGNAQTLNSLAAHETTVVNELETLAAFVEELSDPVLKNHIAEILTGEKTDVKPSLESLTGGIEADLQPEKLLKALAADTVILEMMDLPEEELANTVQKLTENFPGQKTEIEEAVKSVLQTKQVLAEIKPELMAKLADLPQGGQLKLTPQKADMLLKEVFSEKGIVLDPIIKEKLLQELSIEPKRDVSLRDKIIAQYTFKPEKNERKDIDKLLNELKSGLKAVKEEILKYGVSAPKVIETAEKITKNIEFLNEMKNSTFVQIPMLLGDKTVDAELYVFKDKRQKKGGSGGSASALLSLDLSNLGHLEAYIKKEDKSVSCQFRVADELAAALIKANVTELEEKLRLHGYILAGTYFKAIDEPFTLLDKEPVFDDKIIYGKNEVTIGLDAKA